MALLKKKAKDEGGEGRDGADFAPPPPEARSSSSAGAERMDSRLERRWEEAFHRARSR